MDVSENSGTPKYPQILHFNRVFHYKPSILGYPYFWKHPNSEEILWLHRGTRVNLKTNEAYYEYYELAVEPTHLKNMLVRLDHFPNFRGENKKYLKPPPTVAMNHPYYE